MIIPIDYNSKHNICQKNLNVVVFKYTVLPGTPAEKRASSFSYYIHD